MFIQYKSLKVCALVFFLVISGFLDLTPPASAQSLMDQAKQLELKYKSQHLRMRYLLADSKIRYDATGNLVGKWHAGRWTWHSTVEVTKIEAKDRLLRIKANRLLLNYNSSTHKFTPTRSGPVEIEIETSTDADGKIDPEKEIEKAFLRSSEDYPLEMQPYWKPFIACIIHPKTEECDYYERRAIEPDTEKVNRTSAWKPAYTDVYSVGPDVTPPKVKSRVKPTYTDVAQAAGITGTVLLEAVVTKQGGIRILRVIRPLGYGLEENAAEALSLWTFEPGTRMAKPVDVLLTIEVNFNLH